MQKKAVLYLGILFSLPIMSKPSFAGLDCQHDKNTFRCVKYVKNYDGDTPEIRTKNKCEKKKAIEAKAIVHSILD